MTHQKSGLCYVWIAALVFALDQITKLIAVSHVTPYEPVTVCLFFNILLVFNTGAAFSFLSEHPKFSYIFFVAVGVIASVIMLILLKRWPAKRRLEGIALSCILGGAIGNVFDRIRVGFVVDFLDFHVGTWHWPAFNVADSAVCLGVFLFVLHCFFSSRA